MNAILHPGSVYDRPRDVVADNTLSIGEKRAILASWASDAAAVASKSALRELPGSNRMVTIDEVLEALSALDPDRKHHPAEAGTIEITVESCDGRVKKSVLGAFHTPTGGAVAVR